jgi:hypothetical protein
MTQEVFDLLSVSPERAKTIMFLPEVAKGSRIFVARGGRCAKRLALENSWRATTIS